MAGKESYSIQESRELVLLIEDFMRREWWKKNYFTKAEEDTIYDAKWFLEKTYNITFLEKVKSPKRCLEGIFDLAAHPVPVKDRIAAKKHKQKGNEFMQAGKFDLAEAEYTDAVHKDPKNALYYCNRAAAKIRLFMYASAVPDCEKALKLDRRYAKAYGWLGLARAMTGHPSGAIRCYTKALEIEPGNEAYMANMELIQMRMNQTAFIVLKPLLMCSSSLACMVLNGANNNQPLFCLKNKGNSEGDKPNEEINYATNYTIESLD